MNKNMILSLVTTAAILAVAAGAYMLFWNGPRKPADTNEGGNTTGAIEEVDPSISQPQASTTNETAEASGKKRQRIRAARVNSHDFILERTDLNETDRAQLLAINDALDAENLEDLLKVLPDASVSTNVEVRSDLVDALGWFGKAAIIDLLPFMADPDEEVAQSAMDHWTTALGDINNERRKCELVEKALTILSNEEALESMLLEISDCDDLLVMQTLINVIEAEGASAASTKVALSHYEFTTGEKYTTFENAEAWLAENYDMPDEEDDKSEKPAQESVAQEAAPQDDAAQDDAAQDAKEDVAQKRADDSHGAVIGSNTDSDNSGQDRSASRRDIEKDDMRGSFDDSSDDSGDAGADVAVDDTGSDSGNDDDDDAAADAAAQDGDFIEDVEEEDEDQPRILPAAPAPGV